MAIVGGGKPRSKMDLIGGILQGLGKAVGGIKTAMGPTAPVELKQPNFSGFEEYFKGGMVGQTPAPTPGPSLYERIFGVDKKKPDPIQGGEEGRRMLREAFDEDAVDRDGKPIKRPKNQ